jgi:hypothetical protein
VKTRYEGDFLETGWSGGIYSGGADFGIRIEANRDEFFPDVTSTGINEAGFGFGFGVVPLKWMICTYTMIEGSCESVNMKCCCNKDEEPSGFAKHSDGVGGGGGW